MNICELNKKNQIVTLDKKSVYGENVSSYGLENGYVDYKCLSDIVGNMILNNNIIKYEIDYWECLNGSDIRYYNTSTGEYMEYDDIENWDDIEESYLDIYQYYIITRYGYEILEKFTDEIVYYNEELDIYLWGITHYGTSWDYVLTDIKIVDDEGKWIIEK